MQIALNDVLKDDGKILRVDADFGPDTFEMKLGKYPITRKTPVSLVLTNKGKRNLLIQGRMDLTILIPCGRCLEEVPVEFELDFEKKIDMNLTEEERREALDEPSISSMYREHFMAACSNHSLIPCPEYVFLCFIKPLAEHPAKDVPLIQCFLQLLQRSSEQIPHVFNKVLYHGGITPSPLHSVLRSGQSH